ncbi:hypothetical protein [Prosthecobacter dejongeii]|uniref:Uncharacterized protein n=1 Tax=Prosthecobacter dejongeii TaxID=48465 RepID=A0A7W7YMM0_9BACT|nr:hypothetical protein [Prosthecobacter dejongeii]MBB5038827.1 hypothetical protein [Prosthecobacter dejongeii]
MNKFPPSCSTKPHYLLTPRTAKAVVSSDPGGSGAGTQDHPMVETTFGLGQETLAPINDDEILRRLG